MKDATPREHTIIRRRRSVFASETTDNYIAVRGPDRGNGIGAGAPKGNRNALRHGRRGREYIETRRVLRKFCRDARAIAKLVTDTLKAGARPDPAALRPLVQDALLSLRKPGIAKPLTIHQDCAGQERDHEIHLVQPDAVALSAG